METSLEGVSQSFYLATQFKNVSVLASGTALKGSNLCCSLQEGSKCQVKHVEGAVRPRTGQIRSGKLVFRQGNNKFVQRPCEVERRQDSSCR